MQNEGLTTGRQGGWLAMTFPLLLGVFLGLVNGFVFHFFFFFFFFAVSGYGKWKRKRKRKRLMILICCY
jgi:uncharacterized membrane protein